jgi:hypothetical protein
VHGAGGLNEAGRVDQVPPGAGWQMTVASGKLRHLGRPGAVVEVAVADDEIAHLPGRHPLRLQRRHEMRRGEARDIVEERGFLAVRQQVGRAVARAHILAVDLRQRPAARFDDHR